MYSFTMFTCLFICAKLLQEKAAQCLLLYTHTHTGYEYVPYKRLEILAPLAIGQQAYVMVRCPLFFRP